MTAPTSRADERNARKERRPSAVGLPCADGELALTPGCGQPSGTRPRLTGHATTPPVRDHRRGCAAACWLRGPAGVGDAPNGLRDDLAGSWELTEGAGPGGPIPLVDGDRLVLAGEAVELTFAAAAGPRRPAAGWDGVGPRHAHRRRGGRRTIEPRLGILGPRPNREPRKRLERNPLDHSLAAERRDAAATRIDRSAASSPSRSSSGGMSPSLGGARRAPTGSCRAAREDAGSTDAVGTRRVIRAGR